MYAFVGPIWGPCNFGVLNNVFVFVLMTSWDNTLAFVQVFLKFNAYVYACLFANTHVFNACFPFAQVFSIVRMYASDACIYWMLAFLLSVFCHLCIRF
jgi:hypothetical protein